MANKSIYEAFERFGQHIKTLLVGKKTLEGGEVFNDYTNNKAISEYASAGGYNTMAGGKAFTIKNIVEKQKEKLVTLNIPASVISELSLTDLRLRIQFTHEMPAEGRIEIRALDSYGLTWIERSWYNIGNLNSTTDRYEIQPCLDDYNFDGDYVAGGTVVGLVMYPIKNNAANSSGGIMSSSQPIPQALLDSEGNFSVTFKVINHCEYDLNIVMAFMGDNVNTDPSVTLFNQYRTTTALQTGDGLSFTIDNTDGIEINDIWSLYSTQLGTNLDFYGKVTAIDSTGIYVDKIPEGLYPLNANTINYIWFPYKPYLNGDVDIGYGSRTNGYDTIAIPFGASADGYNTIAGGKYARVSGNSTKAGYAGHAQNLETEAIGVASSAKGTRTQATGRQSDAGGMETIASGDNAVSRGYRTEATGSNADAGGSGTTSSGNMSFTRGLNTKATADRGFAIGNETEANAKDSFAAGWKTKTNVWTQTVVGKANLEDQYALFIVGNGTGVGSDSDTRKNAFVVKSDGSARLAKGGTANDSVVTYKQLTDYVDTHTDLGSPWDAQSEMLFSKDEGGEGTGSVKVVNNNGSSSNITVKYKGDGFYTYDSYSKISPNSITVSDGIRNSSSILAGHTLSIVSSTDADAKVKLQKNDGIKLEIVPEGFYYYNSDSSSSTLYTWDLVGKMSRFSNENEELFMTGNVRIGNRKCADGEDYLGIYSDRVVIGENIATWEDIISAANFVKNLIDVSTDGQ